ncbi:MAG: long-chain fatty acid--CoA ligase, partial [Candidatus Eisenbacteria bacterium]|nr:long-chain fatty acid--CoA ligase [Candidatus Eisenbacteria bacterium]
GRSKYVTQVMVCGDSRKHLAALVVPDREALEQYARSSGIAFEDYAGLLKTDEIRELISGEIAGVNKTAPSYEQVRGFELLPEAFTLENGMLTPTLKPRRGRITMIHEELIERMYEHLDARPAAGGDSG